MSPTTEVVEVQTLASAKPVEQEFEGLVAEVERLKATALTLEVKDENDTRTMKIARETRLTLREIRIGVDKRRKELKEDYLRKGQRIDNAAKEITRLIEPLEARMLEQEQFAERKAAERQDRLQAARVADLHELGAPSHMIVAGLGTLTDHEWEILRRDAEALKACRDGEAKRAEEERVAAERAAAEERERQARELAEARAKAEEERIAREAAEAAAKAEREEQARVLAEAQAKARAERDAAEAARLEAERKADAERKRLALEAAAECKRLAAEAAAKLQAEREEHEAKLIAERKANAEAAAAAFEAAEKERKERARLELEARLAKEAAAKAERARLEAQAAADAKAKEEADERRRAALAPDAEKIRVLAVEVDALTPKLSNAALDSRLQAAVRNFTGILETLAKI